MALRELNCRDQGAFDSLYKLYADLFSLADEREPPEAFHEILALNEDLSVQERLGPYREVIASASLMPDGPVVGGHVFGITTSPAHRAAGLPASIQGIYTFLDAAHRGALPIPAIRHYSDTVAIETFGHLADGLTRRPPMILEVNNPLRMTGQQIEEDTRQSGVHPARRYMLWRRSGFSPLDFRYVQPRLRADAEPVDYLDLFCSTDSLGAIPRAVLLNHLHAFISISVLKGRDADEDADFASMRERLTGDDPIRFRDAGSAEMRQIARLALRARFGTTV